ncbi:pentatricopeptide repeat-containing protein At1g77360, mitochondrial isoform X2 [Phalaenopsis equestris]|nr:pentatricopeptide repeat-containing protein At1g77360, mitochondrial isoform X2 [Phalaenopsis equestris]
MKQIYRIMSSCPKMALEKTLDDSGIWVSPDMAEEVLHHFENAGMLAYHFFTWTRKQREYSTTTSAYHSIITSLAKIRQYQLVWEIVGCMRHEGVLNIETFSIIIRKYARAQKVDEALYTFNVMERYGLVPNLAAFNSLLSAFCKSKNVRKAQEVFDEWRHRFKPDVKTYSILLEGWGREPNLPRMWEVFDEMTETGCIADIVTYGIMVDALCKAGSIIDAVNLVREMPSRGCQPTSFIYSVLVHTYGVERRIEDAVDTFLDMQKNGVNPDVAAYNALISAFCRANRFENALRVLEEMGHKGVSPNSRTCNTILSSLIGVGENDEAYRVFRRMIEYCEPDSDTYTMMIKMFCETDMLSKALKVWKYMGLKRHVPSMHTFSVLINGLCEEGEVGRACVLMEEMIEKGIKPPESTLGRLRQLLLKEKREDVLEFLVEKIKLLVKEPLCD